MQYSTAINQQPSPATPAAAESARAPAAEFLAFWLALAALSQLAYLAHWPLFVFGMAVPFTLTVAVALVRMAVYLGLAEGLKRRDPAAWGGAMLELIRTVLVFALVARVQGWTVVVTVYPGGWTIGALAGALPVLLGLNSALSAGWRPGPGLERDTATAVQVLLVMLVWAAMALRREAPAFGIAPERQASMIFWRGLPFVALLSAAEGLAYWLALQGLPGLP